MHIYTGLGYCVGSMLLQRYLRWPSVGPAQTSDPVFYELESRRLTLLRARCFDPVLL